MQYILTHEEYYNLINSNKKFEKEHSEMVQKLCTQVANHMPIKFWGNEEARVWTCILNDDAGMEYCDECPVQNECPHPYKHWSK